ncbi:hypothetical protein Nepgr_025661 [Nepenthes gracilis]|uniref:Uncharacterized protein n=1 Tax=Nepenthes gracilis TaxID=150966 RepID=A0AAD3XZW6_NEPGR|nr:hypothetical protein Nepgr_025661 [Nepenthes gracilis]
MGSLHFVLVLLSLAFTIQMTSCFKPKFSLTLITKDTVLGQITCGFQLMLLNVLITTITILVSLSDFFVSLELGLSTFRIVKGDVGLDSSYNIGVIMEIPLALLMFCQCIMEVIAPVQPISKVMPILGPFHQVKTTAANLTCADHITNVFRYFECHGQGYVEDPYQRPDQSRQRQVVDGKESKITFNEFPYYLSEQTRVLLTSATYVHLKYAEVSKST